MDWFSKIDPNVALALLVGVATWVYHRVRGDAAENFSDMLQGVGKQVIHLVLTNPDTPHDLDLLRVRVTNALWDLAAKAKIPRNAVTEALAQTVIEHTIGDILEQLRARDALPGQLADLSTKAQAVLATFASAEAEGRARVAGMKDLIESQDAPASGAPAPATIP